MGSMPVSCRCCGWIWFVYQGGTLAELSPCCCRSRFCERCVKCVDHCWCIHRRGVSGESEVPMRENDERDPWAFLDSLSPVTRRFVLDWLEVPWTLYEMLTDEPDKVKAMAILEELDKAGVVQYRNGIPALFVPE